MIKITTESTEKDIGFIIDVDPEFVSLVRHGANQQPFKIIKAINKGGENVKVIQSILLPGDADIQDLITHPGLEYLSEAQIDEVKKTEEYQSYQQIPTDKVENYQLIKAGNGWLVVGTIKKDAEVDNALAVTEEQFEKLEKLPIPEAFSDDSWMVDYGPTFMDGIHREVYALVDVIGGTLRQASIDSSKRKKNIFNAIASFKSFMGLALDALGEGTANTDQLTKIKEQLEGENTMFKTAEEFEDAAGKVIDTKLDAFMEKIDEKLAGLTTPVKKEEDTVKKEDEPNPVMEAITALTSKLDDLGTQFGDLKTKVDGTTETESAKELEEIKKEEADPETKKKHVFDGILTRQVA